MASCTVVPVNQQKQPGRGPRINQHKQPGRGPRINQHKQPGRGPSQSTLTAGPWSQSINTNSRAVVPVNQH
ncbi:hypothetical protein BsWGS_14499 [Bradybaena similaris]